MFMTAGFRDRAEVLFPESIPTGSRPWHLLRKFALILRAACPQTPCKDGIHPHLYRCGPLPYFDSIQRSSRMEKPSRGGKKTTAVWASHPEERGRDEVVAPAVCDPRVVPHRWVVCDR